MNELFYQYIEGFSTLPKDLKGVRIYRFIEEFLSKVSKPTSFSYSHGMEFFTFYWGERLWCQLSRGGARVSKDYYDSPLYPPSMWRSVLYPNLLSLVERWEEDEFIIQQFLPREIHELRTVCRALPKPPSKLY